MAIVVLEPASSGTALIEAACRMGKTVHVLSADYGDRKLNDSLRAVAAAIHRVETHDVDAVTDMVRRLQRSLKVEAIVPGFEYMVDVAARVASRFNLPGLPIEVARCTRNKTAMREVMVQAGLAGPVYKVVERQGDLAIAAAHVGFPAVLKPVDGCGSLMVRRVDSMEELTLAFLQSPRQCFIDMGRYIGSRLMLEEYIAGREFSVEGIVDGDGPQVIAITEKLLGPEPHFVEIGHVVEADIDAEDRTALEAYVIKATQAIGLTLGVFHAEVRLSPRGPVLMEIAARLGGDRIYRLIELTKSISLPELMIDSYCGAKQLFYRHLPSKGIAGVRFFTLKYGNRFAAIDGIAAVRAMRGFEELDIYYAPEDFVPDAADFRGRLGHVLFTAPDRLTLEHRLNDACDTLRFLPISY